MKYKDLGTMLMHDKKNSAYACIKSYCYYQLKFRIVLNNCRVTIKNGKTYALFKFIFFTFFALKDDSGNPVNKLQEYCGMKMLPFQIEVGHQPSERG